VNPHPVRSGPSAHPAEEHRAEHDVVPAGHRRQHPRPDQVEQRRRRHPEAPRDRAQPNAENVIHDHTGLGDRGAVAPHIQQAERSGRLGHVTEQPGEEPLMLMAGHRVPGVRHVVA